MSISNRQPPLWRPFVSISTGPAASSSRMSVDHRLLQPQEPLCRPAPRTCRSSRYPHPRPVTYPRLAAPGSQRPPQVRPGTPRMRRYRDHAGFLCACYRVGRTMPPGRWRTYCLNHSRYPPFYRCVVLRWSGSRRPEDARFPWPPVWLARLAIRGDRRGPAPQQQRQTRDPHR